MSDGYSIEGVPEVLGEMGDGISGYGQALAEKAQTINSSVETIMALAQSAAAQIDVQIATAQAQCEAWQMQRASFERRAQEFFVGAVSEADPDNKARAIAAAGSWSNKADALKDQITDMYRAVCDAMKTRDGFTGTRNFMDVFAKEQFRELNAYVPFVKRWGGAVSTFASDLAAVDRKGNLARVRSDEGVWRASGRIRNFNEESVLEFDHGSGYYRIDPDEHALLGVGGLTPPQTGNLDALMRADAAARFLKGLPETPELVCPSNAGAPRAAPTTTVPPTTTSTTTTVPPTTTSTTTTVPPTTTSTTTTVPAGPVPPRGLFGLLPALETLPPASEGDGEYIDAGPPAWPARASDADIDGDGIPNNLDKFDGRLGVNGQPIFQDYAPFWKTDGTSGCNVDTDADGTPNCNDDLDNRTSMNGVPTYQDAHPDWTIPDQAAADRVAQ